MNKHYVNVNIELSVKTTASREEVLEAVAEALDIFKRKGFAFANVGSEFVTIDSWSFDSIEG